MTVSSLRSRLVSVPVRRRLMIVEGGASVFTREGAETFDETVAIAQLQDETPDEFAERCLQRIAAAERSGRCFQAAMLFTSASHDPAKTAARRLIALAVAEHADSIVELRELVVVTAPTAEPEQRDELLDLVEELLMCSGRLPVRVCFTEPPEQLENSGVFWSLPASERQRQRDLERSDS